MFQTKLTLIQVWLSIILHCMASSKSAITTFCWNYQYFVHLSVGWLNPLDKLSTVQCTTQNVFNPRTVLLSRYSLFCADGMLNPFHSLTRTVLGNNCTPVRIFSIIYQWRAHDETPKFHDFSWFMRVYLLSNSPSCTLENFEDFWNLYITGIGGAKVPHVFKWSHIE